MTNQTQKLTTNQVASYFVADYVAEHKHGWGRDAFEAAERDARALFFAWLSEHENETRQKEARRVVEFISSYLESVISGRKRILGDQETSAYESGMRAALQVIRGLGG